MVRALDLLALFKTTQVRESVRDSKQLWIQQERPSATFMAGLAPSFFLPERSPKGFSPASRLGFSLPLLVFALSMCTSKTCVLICRFCTIDLSLMMVLHKQS